MPASRSDWWRAVLLGTVRFVLAVIIYGGALLLSRTWFSGLDRMPVWFVLVASAVLAAVFWMTRKPLQDLVDRLVLGDRADGYAQVRVLLQRMATTLPVDEVVPALAETAGRTVHSSRAEVRLTMSDGDAWSQVWPPRAVADGTLADGTLADGTLADGTRETPRTIEVEVRHAGTEVGEIEVDVTEPDESDRDRRLLNDLARPAGLALSTVRLTLELRRRAAELQTLTDALALSNRRIMLARESELARIDAEMQDRVMPFIDRARAAVAGGVDASGAAGGGHPGGPSGRASGADPGGQAVAAGLEAAAVEVAGALEALRVLARGIYPPRLADAGLAVSLEGWQQRAGVSVDLRVSGDETALHGHEELEACLYFSLVTALGSLSAGAERPVAVVDIGDRDVSWEVTGTVGSTRREQAVQAVRDRVEAFGGTMWAGEAAADRETVRATVPLVDAAVTTLAHDLTTDLTADLTADLTGAATGGPPDRSG